MKILACHNYYQEPGGEDQSFQMETQLLEWRGHGVVRYTRHNDDIKKMHLLRVATKTIWNRRSYAAISDIIQRERPDVLHCHNTFPLISPAVYYAARKQGVPVVQTLRNYRLVCANGFFLREGRTCEDCLGRAVAWPAIYHACYRHSAAGSAVVAGTLTFHRLIKTFQKRVNVFVALTEFARGKFIEAGIPAEKIVVNPNFLTTNPEPGSGSGGYCAFVGRLSPEKGIDTLLDTWSQLDRPLKLKIAGDGAMANRVRAAAAADERIQWLGRQSSEQVLQLVSDAACLVQAFDLVRGLAAHDCRSVCCWNAGHRVQHRVNDRIDFIGSKRISFYTWQHK